MPKVKNTDIIEVIDRAQANRWKQTRKDLLRMKWHRFFEELDEQLEAQERRVELNERDLEKAHKAIKLINARRQQITAFLKKEFRQIDQQSFDMEG